MVPPSSHRMESRCTVLQQYYETPGSKMKMQVQSVQNLLYDKRTEREKMYCNHRTNKINEFSVF